MAFRATGGTITPTGLYTAGSDRRHLQGHRDLERARRHRGGDPRPDLGRGDHPTPPTPTSGAGIPFALWALLAAGDRPGAVHHGSLDGYTAQNIVSRLGEARAKKIRVLMNMTGGTHNNYKTDGVFDMAKWRARMDTYNTPAIRAAVAAAVADGTIIGNSVMDEPHNSTARMAASPGDRRGR